MSIIIILITISLTIALVFLVIFLWALKSGQYDDTDTPAIRMLFNNTKPEDKKADSPECTPEDRAS